MDFKSFLQTYQSQFGIRVFPRCETFLEATPDTCDQERRLTLDLIRQGGKRIRSALVAYLCEGQPGLRSVDFEAWLEIFHVALLIHDDLVDHAQRRRGQPSFHVALGDQDRALIWGDYLFARVAQGCQDVLGTEGSQVFAETFQATCLGQLQDLNFRGLTCEVPSDEALLKSYANKTGIYGFYFPIAGALLLLDIPFAEAGLREWSCRCGQLYQAADDLWLLHPGQDQKSAQSDYELHQHTLVTKRLNRLVPPQQGQAFASWLAQVRRHPELPFLFSELRVLLKKVEEGLSVDALTLPNFLRDKLETVLDFLRAHVLGQLNRVK